MYAERKGWDVGAVEVDVDVGYDGAVPERFEVAAEAAGRAERRSSAERLLAIAAKCPVHKVLAGEATVTVAERLEAPDGPRARRARLRRHRRQPRHRPRDRVAALRRGGQRAAGRPRRGAAARRSRKRPTAPEPQAGGRAAVLALDVTAADAGERMLATATEYFGGLDVLVNNAGAAAWRDLDDVPDEDWRAQYELNVMAPLRAMRAADPGDGRARLGPRRQRLLDRRQAALGGDARVLGRQGGRALALPPLRRPLREDAASSSTRSAPARSNRRCGWSRAACSTSRRRWPAPRSREEALAEAGSKRPIGRLADPAEIAAAIVFLCSERASYVAGAAWSVDGGTVQVII